MENGEADTTLFILRISVDLAFHYLKNKCDKLFPIICVVM